MKHNTDIWFSTDMEEDLLKILNGQDPAEKVSFGNGTHVFSAVRNQTNHPILGSGPSESMVQFQTSSQHMDKSNLLRKAIQFYIKGYTAGYGSGWKDGCIFRG